MNSTKFKKGGNFYGKKKNSWNTDDSKHSH